MQINELLKEKDLSKYRLAKESGIPYTTLNDICNGRTALAKCSAETIYKLAKTLGVSMEQLIEDEMAERPSFELFKSNICHRVKELGDVDFLIGSIEKNEVKILFEKRWYRESLYLLGMIDYLSRINEIPLCKDYEDIRTYKLEKPVYPASVMTLAEAIKSESPKIQALNEAIPEFLRFNIVESEIRNVR